MRLKVRPAEEIGTPVKKDYFKNDDPGAASCGAGGGGGGEEHGANLALLPDTPENVQPPQMIALPMSDAHRNYLDTIPTDTGRLGITSHRNYAQVFQNAAKTFQPAGQVTLRAANTPFLKTGAYLLL